MVLSKYPEPLLVIISVFYIGIQQHKPSLPKTSTYPSICTFTGRFSYSINNIATLLSINQPFQGINLRLPLSVIPGPKVSILSSIIKSLFLTRQLVLYIIIITKMKAIHTTSPKDC